MELGRSSIPLGSAAQLLLIGRDHDITSPASAATSGSIPFRAIADGKTGE
jgi:hypothetical protein